MNRGTFLALLLVAGGIAPKAARAAEGKVAVVSLQRALEETEEGKRAKAKLKADFDVKQKQLDAKSEELKKMKEDFDKQSSILKPDAAAKKQKDLNERLVALQETYQRLQRDLATKEQEATGGIYKKLVDIVRKIADRDSFSVVVEAQTTVWFKPSLDITNEVIRMYNAANPSGEEKPGKK